MIEQLHSKADQRDFDTVPRVELDAAEKEVASKTEVMTSAMRTVANYMALRANCQTRYVDNVKIKCVMCCHHRTFNIWVSQETLDICNCPGYHLTLVLGNNNLNISIKLGFSQNKIVPDCVYLDNVFKDKYFLRWL